MILVSRDCGSLGNIVACQTKLAVGTGAFPVRPAAGRLIRPHHGPLFTGGKVVFTFRKEPTKTRTSGKEASGS
jgi:hypothetical protein